MPQADRPAIPQRVTPQTLRATPRRFLAPIALLWILVPVSFMAPGAARAASPSEKSAARAPGFSLPARDGTTISLESLKGKVVLIDFWASWCGPCQKSFPWLVSLHQKFAAKGLVVVAINLDKKREAAETFLKKETVPFLVAFDPSGGTADAYKVPALPSTYLISPAGAVLYSHVGYDPKQTAELEAAIQRGCAP